MHQAAWDRLNLRKFNFPAWPVDLPRSEKSNSREILKFWCGKKTKGGKTRPGSSAQWNRCLELPLPWLHVFLWCKSYRSNSLSVCQLISLSARLSAMFFLADLWPHASSNLEFEFAYRYVQSICRLLRLLYSNPSVRQFVGLSRYRPAIRRCPRSDHWPQLVSTSVSFGFGFAPTNGVPSFFSFSVSRSTRVHPPVDRLSFHLWREPVSLSRSESNLGVRFRSSYSLSCLSADRSTRRSVRRFIGLRRGLSDTTDIPFPCPRYSAPQTRTATMTIQ